LSGIGSLRWYLRWASVFLGMALTYRNGLDVIRGVLGGRFPIQAKLKHGNVLLRSTSEAIYYALDRVPHYRSKVRKVDDGFVMRCCGRDLLVLSPQREGRPQGRALAVGDAVVLEGAWLTGIYDVFLDQDYAWLDVSGRTVVDVGAAIGDTAIYFVLRGAKRVIACEPYPNLFEVAYRNIYVNNRLDNVVLLHAGCGSSDGEVSVAASGSGWTPLIQAEQGVKVPILSLRTLVSRYDVEEDSALKVDCEGCEYDLILGSDDRTLLRFDRIQMEYHIIGNKGPELIASRLRGLGYRVKVQHTYRGLGYIYAKRE